MIDSLFGSKTRVKLLHLFLNNPGKSFYVREITRKIDEQINSVRRELSNMLEVGIISCDSAENKLYYQVNQRYDYYLPLRAIFGDNKTNDMPEEKMSVVAAKSYENYTKLLESLSGLRLSILSGVLVKGSRASIDLLLVGDMTGAKIKAFVKYVESSENREINYSVMSYDEFYYRLSVRDKFITDILGAGHYVAIDKDDILKGSKGES